MKSRKNAGKFMKRSAAMALALLMLCAIFPAEVFADLVWYVDEYGNLFAVEEPAVISEESAAVPEETVWGYDEFGNPFPVAGEADEMLQEQAEDLPESTEESAAEPEEPFTYITGTAEDSAVFTAYGRFPEGSEMFVNQCDFDGDLKRKVFPAERAEKISEYKAYDVSFTLNGEPYDPDMTLKFIVLPNMQNPLSTLDVSAYSSYVCTVAQNENGIVLSDEQVEQMVAAGEEESIHYISETFYNLFDIETEPQGDNRLAFWSDLYTPLVIYREGFDFEPVSWVLTADGSVTLSSILEAAEIGLGLSDIAEQGIIYLGDPALVKMSVNELDGDWELSAAAEFTVPQTLKIIFRNGGVLNIALYCEGSEPEAQEAESEAETYKDWAEMFSNVELTGNWPQDVVTIAMTQLDYSAGEDGYTRYGAWYGDPYGEWDALFCSFCMAFAGVDSAVMPFEQSCARWAELLKTKELYHAAGSGYSPKAGDLIFFSGDGAEADHVGIVYDNEPGQVVTIEGNNPNRPGKVKHGFYLHDDAGILGYGEMPAAPVHIELVEKTIESLPAEDGAVAVISGNLPANAEAVIRTVTLSENEVSAYLGADVSSAITEYVAYDIKILVNGQEWQPDKTVNVSVRKPELNLAGYNNISVAHINEDTYSVDTLGAEVENENIAFITNGFSTYLFYTFTVDYYYKDVVYHQPGMSDMALSELLRKLGIEKSIADIDIVSFDDETLLSVERTEDDWILRSLRPFSTTQRLQIRFTDGIELNIETKDDIYDYTWWNFHNVVIGNKSGLKFKFHFDYYDGNGNHIDEDRWYGNGDQINAMHVMMGTSCTIKQIVGVYKDANGTEHTSQRYSYNAANQTYYEDSNGLFMKVGGAYYGSYIQIGSHAKQQTNQFVFNPVDDSHRNENICFYEIGNDLGQLTIKKEAVNAPNQGQKYKFVVLHHYDSYHMVATEVELLNGESVTLQYYTDTIYGNNPEIFIAEMTPLSNCTTTFSVNGGTAVKPAEVNLDGRIHEDIGHKYDGYKFIKIPITGEMDTKNVICTNTFTTPKYTLTVKKTVTNEKSGQTFSFEAKVMDSTGLNPVDMSNSVPSDTLKSGTINVLVFNLQGGDSIDLTNIPQGSMVTVTETGGNSGYMTKYKMSSTESTTAFPVQMTGNLTEEVTNTREVENVNLKKVLESSSPNLAGPFTFEIAINDSENNPINVTNITQPSGVSVKDSTTNVLVATFDSFTLSSLSKTLNDIKIPTNSVVTITESYPDNQQFDVVNSYKIGGTTTPGTGNTLVIKLTGSADIEFTNKAKIENKKLTVKKQVMEITTDEAFSFVATIEDGEFLPSDAYTINTDGSVNFTLKDSEFIDLLSEAGATVTVTETSTDGFRVKFTNEAGSYTHDGASDSFEMTEDKSITVVNIPGTELPKSGGEGICQYYATGALLTVSACIYGIILKRKRERRAA